MEARKVTESRTTILYMTGFGIFVIMSYMLVVAPVKEQRECYVRSMYMGEAAAEPVKTATSIKEVKDEQVER